MMKHTEVMQKQSGSMENRFLKVSLGLLVGAIATVTGSTSAAQAQSLTVAKSAPQVKQSPSTIRPLLAQQRATSTFPEDGVYLYGQQPIPDQLATAYLVFESQAGHVVGAFYMPSSSFDCVQGQLQDNEIALTITDSYSQETYDYALGLDHNTTVASRGNASELNISGFYPIAQVSENDQHILATCKAFYGEAI